MPVLAVQQAGPLHSMLGSEHYAPQSGVPQFFTGPESQESKSRRRARKYRPFSCKDPLPPSV